MDGFDLWGIGDGGHDDVRAFGGGRGSRGGSHVAAVRRERTGEPVGLSGRVRGDREREARLREIPGHSLTHRTESDEGDAQNGSVTHGETSVVPATIGS